MDADELYFGEWMSVECANKYHGYVCQKDSSLFDFKIFYVKILIFYEMIFSFSQAALLYQHFQLQVLLRQVKNAALTGWKDPFRIIATISAQVLTNSPRLIRNANRSEVD